ncbi:hypothetical protein ACIRPK_35855 [Kitasatospora sp. NPDC101801]|uniref:hypothetical protein n=1 Tax=Kitasatospora sp. NPDC101801 TaxID=3364103 RepID=UPI00382C755B
MDDTQRTTATRTPAPNTRASLLNGIAEAVHDHDERTLRRLLTRYAEQATLTDLPALRQALRPRPRPVGRSAFP